MKIFSTFFWQFNIQNNPQPLLLRSWESCILVAISLVFLQHKEWLLESLGERKRINPLFTSWSMVTTLQQHLVQLVLNSYRLGGGENQGKLKYRMSKKTVPGSAKKRKETGSFSRQQKEWNFPLHFPKISVSSAVENNWVTRDGCCGWERSRGTRSCHQDKWGLGMEQKEPLERWLHLSWSTACEKQKKLFLGFSAHFKECNAFFYLFE